MKWFNSFLATPFYQRADIIHFTHDEFGQILVLDDGENRVLNFDSPYEQSRMRVNYPYQLAHKYTQMMVLVLSYVKPEHITLYGLGGGSLLRTLHHILPDCRFDVVELREKVVDIAKEYFDIPVDDRVNIKISDGIQAASLSESNRSDLIFSDMYDAFNMVSSQIQDEFLFNCARGLTDNGFLVLNLHYLPDESSELFALIKQYFSSLMINSNLGNVILFASKRNLDGVAVNKHYLEMIGGKIGQQLAPLLPMMEPISH